jgi:hypothetical protein
LTGDGVTTEFKADTDSGHGAVTTFSWEYESHGLSTITGDDLLSLNDKERG